MATNEACSALSKAADDMARFCNLHYQAAPTYKIGDKVWLNAQNITTTHPMNKLDHKWLGPYIVNKVVSQNAYGLSSSHHPLVIPTQSSLSTSSTPMKRI